MLMRGIAALVLSTIALAAGLMPESPASEFEAPVMLKADGQAVRVDSPGYACPCWSDIDGDGKKDLLVGQFANGQIKVYRNLGEGQLAAGEWLQADGKVAEVPGVW